MLEPELYSRNKPTKADMIIALEKYGHLINWNIEGNGKVMDVGCADGGSTANILLPFLPNSVTEVVAIDKSRKMINYAKKNIKNSKISFIEMDITANRNDFLGQFNNIFSFLCLHWCANQRQFIENIYKCLKPGGDVFLTCIGRNQYFEAFDIQLNEEKWSKLAKAHNIFFYYRYSNPIEEISNLFRDVGFTVQACECIRRTFSLTCIELENMLQSVHPLAAKLTTNLKHECLYETIKILDKLMVQNSNGEYCFEYEMIVVVASKSV